ncbi:MAG TPA: GTPase ObgE, partial [Thermoanaerobaculia bacterium]|nr:GTPase ObgE [Thermoanaerobaculia bacterium]
HLVDLSAEGSARADLETVERELAAFNPELLDRSRIVVGSKLDAATGERREELAAVAAGRGLAYLEISSATGSGVRALVAEMAQRLER